MSLLEVASIYNAEVQAISLAVKSPFYIFTKCKNTRKWMIEFLRKFENPGITIARVNSILVTKSNNIQFFAQNPYGVGVGCDRRRFSVHSPFIEKSMVLSFGGCFKMLESIRSFIITSK